MTDDSPANPADDRLTHASINDQYHMYLLYQPNGTGSIWVVLGVLDWNLSVSATKGGGGNWSIDAGAMLTPDPIGHASTTLPEWSQHTDQLGFK
jgi:hypothetical protein